METRKQCDLCGAHNLQPIYPDIVRCQQCGLLFRARILSPQESRDLYREGYFSQEQKDYFFKYEDKKHAMFAERLRRLEVVRAGRGQTTPGDLLDVGAAIGTFLHVANNKGWHVQGFEPSHFAASSARDRYQLDMIEASELPAAQLPPESFDVITLWDSIDHTEHPIALLKEVHRLLRRGGLVALQTNMEDSLLYRVAHMTYVLSFGTVSWFVKRVHPLHHSIFFDRLTLKQTLEKVGFRVLKEQSDDLPAVFIKTNPVGKIILRSFAALSQLAHRPLEVTFYATKE